MIGHGKVSKEMMGVILFSIFIALMISLIPRFGVLSDPIEIPAFNDQKNSYLTNYNIVDFIASFSTEMQIQKVTWEHDTLAIDFSIDSNNLDTNVIYEDLYNFTKKGFIQTSNVKEILLRVMIDQNEKIFVAVSATREDIKSNPTMELDSSMLHKDFLEKYFGLNFGNTLKQE